jgi:hypothetical protein
VPASASAGAVGTELQLGSQSVAPVAAGERAATTDTATDGQGGSAQSTQGQSGTVAQFTRDASTNTLVFMEVDPKTETVVMQFPEEQILKLKSYLAEVARHEDAERKSVPGQIVAKVT